MRLFVAGMLQLDVAKNSYARSPDSMMISSVWEVYSRNRYSKKSAALDQRALSC